MPDWEVRASTQLPIASRDEWDGDEALENVLSFYRNDEDDVDANLAPRGFLLFDADSDGNDQEDYKFPFADIVDGELTAITRGIEVADSFLQDADVDGDVQEKMAEVINEYRRRSDDLNDPDETSSNLYIIPKGIRTVSNRQEERRERSQGVEESKRRSAEHTYAQQMETQKMKEKHEAPDTASLPYEVSPTVKSMSVKDVDVKNGIVTGYFTSWGTVDSDGERFAEGAFDDSIARNGPEADNTRIKQLYQHDIRQILGVPKVLKQDGFGLYFETEIIETSLGQDVLKMYRADALEHSVGFIRRKEEEIEGVNVIKEAELMEGSSVTWGANPDTPFAGFKSMEKFGEYLAEKAKALRKLLSEDIRDIRMEQIELGLRQLESSLRTIDQKQSDGEKGSEASGTSEEKLVDEIEWPPSANFFKTEDSDEEKTVSFF